MQNLQLVHGIHVVQDLEFTRCIRRLTGRKDFLTYRHEFTQNWMAAVWRNRDAGIIKEIECLGAFPDQWTSATVHRVLKKLLSWWNPRDLKHRLAQMPTSTDNLMEIQDNWNQHKASLRSAGIDEPMTQRGTLTE